MSRASRQPPCTAIPAHKRGRAAREPVARLGLAVRWSALLTAVCLAHCAAPHGLGPALPASPSGRPALGVMAAGGIGDDRVIGQAVVKAQRLKTNQNPGRRQDAGTERVDPPLVLELGAGGVYTALDDAGPGATEHQFLPWVEGAMTLDGMRLALSGSLVPLAGSGGGFLRVMGDLSMGYVGQEWGATVGALGFWGLTQGEDVISEHAMVQLRVSIFVTPTKLADAWPVLLGVDVLTGPHAHQSSEDTRFNDTFKVAMLYAGLAWAPP